MKERGLLQEGIPAPLDLSPIRDPEHHIQRKEAVLRHNFCEHVQKMHQDKNTPFKEEYQVLFVYRLLGLALNHAASIANPMHRDQLSV